MLCAVHYNNLQVARHQQAASMFISSAVFALCCYHGKTRTTRNKPVQSGLPHQSHPLKSPLTCRTLLDIFRMCSCSAGRMIMLLLLWTVA